MNTKHYLTEQDAFALLAAGFEHQHVPEYWRDVGGPESGPKLVGGPAYDLYSLVRGERVFCIYVDPSDHEVMLAEWEPHFEDVPF